MTKFTIEPAPIAGYTDQAFRQVLRKCGFATTWTEMISVTALHHNNEKTKRMLTESDKANTVVQLFGKNPEHYAKVIKSGILDGFKEININMGCPARKITSNGDGCALMKNVDLAREIIEACASTGRKISVKFRLGFYEREMTAVEFAKMCEEAGASRVIVHGRYGTQGYTGVADWNAIAKVVSAVKIPVIANGDIRNMEDAKKCIEVTGASGVMVARALLGRPWFFDVIQSDSEGSQMDSVLGMHPTSLCVPSSESRWDPSLPLWMTSHHLYIKKIIKYHIECARDCHALTGLGGAAELRKHLLLYANHLPNKKELKECFRTVSSFDEALQIIN